MILNIYNFLCAKINKIAGGGSNAEWVDDIVKTMNQIVGDIMWPAIAIILTLGIVYVIILGVNYAKAETSDKKEEAKKRMINAVVGVVIMLALIAILNVVITNIDDIVTWVNGITGGASGSASE